MNRKDQDVALYQNIARTLYLFVFCNVVVEVGVVSFLHSRLGEEHKNNSGRLVLVAAVMFRDETVRKPGQELVAVDG